MKVTRKIAGCFLAALSFVGVSFAQNSVLPSVPENTPSVAYTHSTNSTPYGLASYNVSTEVFSMTGTAVSVNFPPLAGLCGSASCPARVLSVTIQVDNNGNLIGGNPTAGQPDFVLTGQVTNGTTTYTSPLLTGQITQFYFDGVNKTPNFGFRFAVTGGSMASLYLNPPSMTNDLWMALSLESLTGTPVFTGSFATNFGGQSKGNVYSTPGVCTGSIGDFVWNDLNANGIQDAGEPGIDGVTVNLYNASNALIQTTVTAAGPTGSQQGYYQFMGICAGTYTVQVDQTTLPKGPGGQTEFVPTIVNAPGSNTADDSNPNPSTVTLTANNSVDETIDFGFVALQGAIGDYVWYDANRNGLQDAGEPGINGVTVDLYDATQTNLLATTVTAFGGPNNVNGYYQFTGLGAGNYVVVVDATTLPSNYSPTTSFVGSNPAIDSNGSPAPVTLPTDSSVDETIDFGYVSPCDGTIGDFVWHDLNYNGIQDTGEPGISGVTLYLYDDDNNLLQTAITNGAGNYLFSGVCAGSYTVVVNGSTVPSQFTPTTPMAPGSTTANDSNGSPAPVTLTLDSNNNVISDLTIDFGYVSPCNGAIGDFVWYDINGNGIQDAGEPGIGNVTVNLFDSQNHLLWSTQTNGVGYYQFTGLCPGTYSVQVVPPTGYSPTLVNAPGSTTANDSNPNPSTVVLSIIDSNGDTTVDETIDFGFILTTPVSSTCVYINAEQGIAITPTQLVGSGGLGGPYTFTAVGLPPGLSISSSGLITGTPTASGTYPYTVTITDVAGNTGTLNCSVTVAPPPSLSCTAVTSGEVGVAFNSGAPTVTGGTAPYTFSVVGTLPAGLTLNSTTGAVTGTPTAPGSFSIQVTDADGAVASGTCPITIIPGPSLSCTAVTSGEVGVPFNSGAPTVTGGTAPYTFSVVGTLPAGLTLNPSTGAVTGTPTAPGSFSIQVTDANGVVASGTCPITIIPGPSLSCTAVTSGEVSVPFNSGAPTVTGGTAPYTFSVVGTLPAGLSLNPSTGVVSGTPTAPGSFSIQVKDANGVVASGTCPITIIPPPSLSCTAVTSGEVSVPFNSGAPTVTGGTAPYTFSVVGTLPAGLSLNPSTGVVSGTPTAPGSFSIQVKDANGVVASGTCPITIIAPPSLSCTAVTSGEVGVSFNSGAPTVTGGTSPYTFSVVGTLPAGLSLNPSTGVVSGTPTAPGSFSIQVKDANGVVASGTCPITIIAPPSLSCTAVTSGEVGVSFNSGAPTVTGGTSPYTFSVVGTLPAGLSLNPSTGVVSGTPTAPGSFSIQVKDANGVVASGTCPITIIAPPSLSCTAVTSGEVGVSFNSGAPTVTGGTSPYTFSVVGTLPAGLSLNPSTGVVSGTPTAPGSFSIQVKDANGVVASGTCPITIIAPPSLSCTAVTSGEVGVSFNSGAPTVTGGTSPYTFSVVGTLPAGLSLNPSTGVVSGTPTAPGSFSIQVKDANGVVASGTCPITIIAPPSLSCTAVTSGEVGVSFNSGAPTVTGGTSPYTFSVVGTLPAGLSLNPSTGVVSGTPTAPGSFSIQVKDANGVVASGTCPITIIAGPSLSCTSITGGQVGVSFNSGTPTVTGGTAPYTFSIVGTLPAGLTLNTSTGAVTGTPTAPGSFSIQVKDAKGIVASGTCPITIVASVSATCVYINAIKGIAITPVTLVASGGSGGPYTFTATGLPSGLSISSGGTISGTPTVTGTFNYTVTITDAAGHTGTLNCSVTVVPPVTANCGCTTATEGVAISPVQLTGSGGSGGPYTFTATGLPTGLTLSSSGLLSGTPTVSGTFNYTVTVTDNTGHSGTVKCSITVNAPPPVTSNCVCTTGKQGVALTPATMTGSGGVGGPYTFTATGLPAGVTISSSGTISGTPTVSGTFNYTVTVTDKAGNKGTVNCTIVVTGTPVCTSCVTINAAQGSPITPVTLVGSGGAGGPYTFSATGLPAGLTMSSSGTISGTPTVSGTFNYTVTVTDSKGNKATFNCSIKVCPPVGGSGKCADGQKGHSIPPTQISGSGGWGGAYTFKCGSLPPGLSISSSGVISGTPTSSGNYNYTVTVYDNQGNSGTVKCMSNISN